MFRKKSKYKHVSINKKKFYFYKISWLDITADGGHATAEEFDKFECSKMVTFAYVYKKTKSFSGRLPVMIRKTKHTQIEMYFPLNVLPRWRS